MFAGKRESKNQGGKYLLHAIPKFEPHLFKLPDTDMMSYTASTLNARGWLLDASCRPLRQEVWREAGTEHHSRARWARDVAVGSV